VLDELDSDPATEQAVFIYSLRNARARNLEAVVNTLFGGGLQAGGITQRGTQQQQQPQRGTQQQQQQPQRQQTTPFGQGGQTTGGTFGQFAMQQQQAQQQRGGTAATAAQQRLSPQAAGTASDLFGQVYVVADEDTNSLLVATGSRHFDRIREVLEELDRPVPQVLIKVLLAEVTHSDGLDLGVEFSVLNRQAFGGEFSQIGTEFGVSAATGGAVYRLTRDDVTAAVRALATVGKLDVLSRPYILTSDNQPARILVGQQVPIPRNTRTTETGQTISNIDYRDAGIILEVTPHINPEGLVIMDVAPSISALTESTVQIAPGFNAPVFNERSAFSRVAIRDGETIVIGGLMEDRLTQTVQKVPLLGDIPVIRHLFRRTISNKSKTELLIFLTPHVAQAPEVLRDISDGERDNARVVPQAVEPGAFQDHMRSMERLEGRRDRGEGRMTDEE
jgi:general secretion pathway protein D